MTCNRKDYVLLHDAWQHWSRRWGIQPEHAGILVVDNTWSSTIVAERVYAFFMAGQPIANRLYRWVAGRCAPRLVDRLTLGGRGP